MLDETLFFVHGIVHFSSYHVSPDGKHLATASKDNTARVWEVASGACVVALSLSPLAVHFAHDSISEAFTPLYTGHDEGSGVATRKNGASVPTRLAERRVEDQHIIATRK